MRLLLLSDIHANLEALEACLAAAPKYDQAVNLGDIVGYGASPNEVIERSRAAGSLFVRGNHDKVCAGLGDVRGFNYIAAAAVLWTQEQLTPDNTAWLRALRVGPLHIDGIEDVQVVHGSPRDEDEYLLSGEEAADSLASTRVPITFFGHTHVQGGFFVRGKSETTLRPRYYSQSNAETVELPLDQTGSYLINPGSVGQPRDGDWRAGFAVYDSDSRLVTFARVPYDVESAKKRILAANLPERLASRLSHGR